MTPMCAAPAMATICYLTAIVAWIADTGKYNLAYHMTRARHWDYKGPATSSLRPLPIAGSPARC